MLPSSYKPKSIEDFIGPARKQAADWSRLLALARADGSPICFLILGRPGLGKSELSNFITRELTTEHWNITRLNGKEVDIEKAESLARDFRLRSMFPGYRVLQIEEIDRMTKDAQVRFLTVLDDLPKWTAVVGSSNCKLADFEERFQRRFHVAQLIGPQSGEILELLLRLGVPDAGARMLSVACGGNVGIALKEADEHVALIAA